MPHRDLEDARKLFILTTTENYFGVKTSSDSLISSLADCRELNNFLDDGNEFVLSVHKPGSNLRMSNKVRLSQVS